MTKPQTQAEMKAAQSNAFKIRKVPSFSSTSRNDQKCSLTGTAMKPRDPRAQEHEVDDFILRGPAIQSEGFFDFRPSALRALALEFTDLVPPADEDALLSLQGELDEARRNEAALAEELAAADRIISRLSAAAQDEEPEAEEPVFFDNPEDLEDDDEDGE